MESVGQQLRQARLRLGLTLEEISAKTRISVKNLNAIEGDDLSQIGSAFFYKSFVRQFAEELHLDVTELAPAIQSATSVLPEPRMPGQVDSPAFAKVPALEVPRRRNFRWLSSVASLGFLLVACSTFYGMWQSSKANWRSSFDNFVQNLGSSAAQQAAPSGISSVPVQSSEPVQPVVAYGKQAEQPATPASGDAAAMAQVSAPAPSVEADTPEFRIQVSALERTWLSIVADGKQTFKGTLDTSQTKLLEGRETARTRTGNAGGINFVFNGKDIGTLGPRGQVRTVVFTKDNYQVLDAPPHIALTAFTFPSVE